MNHHQLKKLSAIVSPDNLIYSWAGREAYASDASIYKAYPQAIIIPPSSDLMREALAFLIENEMAFTPRGGGSSLVGGSITNGVLIDFSRMNRLLHVDQEHKTVEVECGMIYEQLNRQLESFGLFFPPDPSSGDTCQIGGMLANNSSGARSVKYGTTRRYVEEIRLILPDGTDFQAKDFRCGSPEISSLFERYPVFKKIHDLVMENREFILKSYPDLKKNVCGYDLKAVVEFLTRGIFALPQLFVGSEGTLGVFVSARLRLLPLPKSKLTSLVLFERLDEVGDAAADLLQLAPAGLELIDGNTLDLIGRHNFNLPKSAEAMLIVEFDEPPFEETVNKFRSLLAKFALSGPPIIETDLKRQNALWRARKAIVPTLYRLDKIARPWGFIEDAAVPTASMPEFIKFLNDLFKEHELVSGIFGHIGDGNLHIRPAVDLSSEKGQKLAQLLHDQVYEKVFSMGGSATAEHGDGRMRTDIIVKQYGEKIYRLFVQIKECLDPKKLSNPGVMLSSRHFLDDLDLEKVVRECAACGKCNYYCPSYEVHKTENMAARGWVRVMLSRNYDYGKAKAETDGCLNCKSCKVVCPAGVDVSRYVTQRRSENPTFWGKRAFALMDKGRRFETVARWDGRMLAGLDHKSLRPVLEMISTPLTKINRKRILPKFARRSLRQRYPHLTDPNRGEVAYFHGCADNLLESNTAPALINLLEKFGHKIVLPEQLCCGMPQQTYGFFDYERKLARYNLDSLDRYQYIVFSCATCLGATLSYPHLFAENDQHYQKAKSVAAKCYDISEFLLKFVDLKFKDGTNGSRRITFHQPCHLREVGREDRAEKLLNNLPNTKYVPMEDASFCCGSAGTYNIFHYENSLKIFERKKKAVEKIRPDLILTNCPTCILQFIDGLKSPGIACHSVELVHALCGLEL